MRSNLAFLVLLSVFVAGPTNSVAAAVEDEFLSSIRQLTFEGRRAGEGYFSADGTQMTFQSERDLSNPFYQIQLMDMLTGDVATVSPGYGKTTCAWIHPSGQRVIYASTHEDPEARAKMQAELEFRASGQERRYSWDYDEHFEIYTQDLATAHRTNLTNALGYDAEGSYSPDGTRIAFSSNRRAYSGEMSAADAEIFEHDKSYMMDIFIMDADGSNLRQLTDSPGYDGGPFFSPDGSMITWRRFSVDGSIAEIFTMDLATGVEHQLTRTGVMSWAPYFHPSGDYLIYASNAEGFSNFELFLVDAGGTREPVRVTSTEGFDGLPVFSPDGTRLSWTSNRTASKQSQIYLANWNDATARRALQLEVQGAELKTSVYAILATTSADIRAEDAKRHVVRLTDDDMDGRLTGTQGEALATAYVAEVFEQLGLHPGGDGGSFFQSFSFTAGASLSKRNEIFITGLEEPAATVLDSDWRPLALSKNGEIEQANVVFAGYGIVAPASEGQPEYDAYRGLDVTNKWVVVLRYQPESVSPDRRRHLLRYSNLAYKASWAKRHGALGLIVVTGPNAAAKNELVALQMDANTATTSLAAVSITDELASHILHLTGKDLKQLQDELDSGEVVDGFAIPTVTVEAMLDIVREEHRGRNVIGVLAGQQSVGPPLVVGAHVDHLGRGQASGSLARDDEQGEIHRGADDNASGVAGMLESAQYLVDLQRLSKLSAKRDIIFAAWSGEELGTLGSAHYVEQLAGSDDDLQGKVSAYLNFDMIGRVDEQAYLQGTGSSSVWAREIERRNIPVGLSIATSTDPYLPTDSTPFYMQGVPILAAFSGVHEEYSTPRDTENLINYDGLRDITRLMTGIVRSLARSESEPDYVQVERSQGGVGRSNMRVSLGTIPAYGQEEGVVGVKLQGAVKGSPAERAGVQGDDILVGLAGVEIETIYDFMSILGGLKADEETGLTVLRDGKRVNLRVVPTARE